MKNRTRHRSLIQFAFALGLAISLPTALHAQHGHLNAGATGTNYQDQLIWANGADFIASSGYVKTLDYTNSGRFAGYYQQNITLTALPATLPFGGPDPDAAALGANLQFEMSCFSAPPGGAFGFWDVGSTSPSVSLTDGQSSPLRWRLSENNGVPGTDPFGHIHGRRFSATKPGLYQIGFQVFDVSTNGPGGGPIQSPSTILPVWFQAGVNIESVEPDFLDGHVHVRFGAKAGYLWQVEYTAQLGPDAEWKPVDHPVTGADTWVEVFHDLPPGEQRFYRVTGTPASP